jgi:ATP-binding cassette subfamily F protein uup
MTKLLSLNEVSLAYGLHPLLNKIKLDMHKDERLCLIGRNGEGKSSLLKIIDGAILPDSGMVWRKPHLRIARLQQTLPLEKQLTVYEYVASGLEKLGNLLAQYHLYSHELSQSASSKTLKLLENTQQEIDSLNGWQYENTISSVLTRLNLSPDQQLSSLSGGWLRRAALAQALVISPDLLLLDEPTNHLDIEAIEWLEEQILATKISLIFVTHDRRLMQKWSTRIIELDRGNLTSWECDYKTYLQRKNEQLKTEENHFHEYDKKLAQEEKWIRQGIKARRTRNEGRVRALEAMRLHRASRRERKGLVNLSLSAAPKSGQLVFDAKDVNYVINDITIIRDLSLRVMQGDRIGIIGKNGVGKSTLLNLLLGHLIPTNGTIDQGSQLAIAYFDQKRAALDPLKTVRDNVAEGRDFVEVDGKPIHIISYLNNFLFTPERAMTPVKALSGGECNRLLLAKLFTQPANLLIMDEPTNDLDVETLELLEELLINFTGTVLLVSHDRTFLDHVVTSTLVFSGNGQVDEYVGGYQSYMEQQVESALSDKSAKPIKNASTSLKENLKKLNFKEKKELAALPKEIEHLEQQLKILQQKVQAPDFYKAEEAKIKLKLNELMQVEEIINQKYQRWSSLEALNNADKDRDF